MKLKRQVVGVYELIEHIKSQGISFAHNRKIKTFYYTENHTLHLSFSLKVLKPNDLKKLLPVIIYFLPYFFSYGTNVASLLIYDESADRLRSNRY